MRTITVRAEKDGFEPSDKVEYTAALPEDLYVRNGGSGNGAADTDADVLGNLTVKDPETNARYFTDTYGMPNSDCSWYKKGAFHHCLPATGR